MKEHFNQSIAVVFGGHSPIAIETACKLSDHQQVCLVTRQIDDTLKQLLFDKPNISFVESDLTCKGSACEVISNIYKANNSIDKIVFLQRYRAVNEKSFSDHCSVELWCIRDAIQALVDLKDKSQFVQIVVTSSPAASLVLVDQDIDYHIVKASQEAIVRFFSVKYSTSNLSMIGVRIGSIVIKHRAANYWNSIPKIVAKLTQSAPSARLLTSELVSQSLVELLSVQTQCLSGQVVTLDDGWSLRDPAQVAKAILDDPN